MSSCEKRNFSENIKIVEFNEVVSTNSIACEMAKKGQEEGTLIIAKSQNGGRGRLGRSFFSAEGGLYMSLILRPALSPHETLLITAAAAVAAAKTIEKTVPKKAHIKWVNDIYVEDKKVCGILCEGAINPQNQTLDYAVLGIGINLFAPKTPFPPELNRAGFLLDIPQNRQLLTQTALDFCSCFMKFYRNIEDKAFMEEYAARSYLDGKTIIFEREGKTFTATVQKIDQNGALVVECEGETLSLTSGDVQIKEFA